MARTPIGDFMHPTKPQMVSYAQNAEDVVLMRALSDVESGFYVDVGAWHPETDSVTKAFYDRGWCGVNVEPQPDHFRALREQRPRDINLRLVVSDQPGPTTLWVPRYSALATCDFRILNSEIPDYRDPLELEVRSKQLSDIFREHVGSREVHFLKVDVEGLERSVLASLDLAVYRPFILVIEATSPVDNAPTWHQWESIVLSSGYQFALFDGLNRFYLREESRDRMSRLSVPANCLDGFISFRELAIRDRLKRFEEEQVRSSPEASAGR